MSKWLIVAVLLGFGCAGNKSIRKASDVSGSSLRNKIVREASTYLGVKYRYGGNDRKGFDCSGLVMQVYKTYGILLPRASYQQASFGKLVSLEKTRVGDLIFFKQKGRVNHVAIVSRSNRNGIWVIHSTTSQGVIQESLHESSYWSRRVYCTRDVLGTRY